MTLIEMAIAFVLRDPAVTAAIIGPRTMEHLESQLAAADVGLPGDVTASVGTSIEGRSLQATDLDWSYGSGRFCAARLKYLALVLCGRTIPEGRLEGEPF
jgi:hypothetical protein